MAHSTPDIKASKPEIGIPNTGILLTIQSVDLPPPQLPSLQTLKSTDYAQYLQNLGFVANRTSLLIPLRRPNAEPLAALEILGFPQPFQFSARLSFSTLKRRMMSFPTWY